MNVEVRGNATAEELAAVLAVVAQRDAAPPRMHPYERWRKARLAALHGCETIAR